MMSRREKQAAFGAVLCACGIAGLLIGAGAAKGAAEPQAPTGEWKLVWSDEFDQADGSAPDPKKWIQETGGNGWGNHELEYYTARRDNSRVEDGKLVIEARAERYTGQDGVAREYTSARLKTKTLFSRVYGKFESRIRIPYGQGMWPAFWMLGEDIDKVGWPNCGEIDIMENIGVEPGRVHGTLHGPGFFGGKALTDSYKLPLDNFADDFHLFAVEWEPKAIRFYVDGNLYETRTPSDLPAGARWPFDHAFFVLLNVAVGGDWPKDPDATTKFPQRMLVDYVRVYERK